MMSVLREYATTSSRGLRYSLSIRTNSILPPRDPSDRPVLRPHGGLGPPLTDGGPVDLPGHPRCRPLRSRRPVRCSLAALAPTQRPHGSAVRPGPRAGLGKASPGFSLSVIAL